MPATLSSNCCCIKGDLPPRRLTEFVMYSDSEEAMPVFKTTNNLHFTQEVRRLVIEIEEGLKDDPVPPTKLGSFVIPLNRIEEQTPQDEAPITFKVAAQTSEFLRRGEVEIEVRRRSVDREYIQRKRQEVERKLSDQIETIVRFNEEQNSSGSCKVTGNVRGQGRVSLLHAAIQLQMEDLVNNLVELDAVPNERSDIGTPFGLALKLKDRIEEKLQKMKAEERDAFLIEKQKGLFERYQRIVDLLRSKKAARTQPQQDLVSNASSEKPTALYEALPQTLQGNMSDSKVSAPMMAHEMHIDVDILRDILRSAPTPAGHLPGTAATKHIVECRLKEMYPNHFRDKHSVDCFFERVVSQHIATEVGVGNSVLELCEKGGTKGVLKPAALGQLPDDEGLLRELLQTAPVPAGYLPGTAATKCNVGSRLKETYGRHFPDRQSYKAFFGRIIWKGIAVEEGSRNNLVLKLRGASNGSRSETSYGNPQHLNELTNQSASGVTATSNQDKNYYANPEHLGELSEALPGDLDLVRAILKSSPPLAGYGAGKAIGKSGMGIWLRRKYPMHFRTKTDLTEFCERIVSKGLVEQTRATSDIIFLAVSGH
jgi:hypothetical protein